MAKARKTKVTVEPIAPVEPELIVPPIVPALITENPIPPELFAPEAAMLPKPVEPRITREQWLEAAAKELVPAFTAAGMTYPEKLRMTCGFPSRRATGAGSKFIGQCFAPTASADGTTEVMVSPVIAEAMDVLAVLGHELVHACVGCDKGHGPEFRDGAIGIGLAGKMTATVPGEMFSATALPIIAKLGTYPHATLDASTLPKQTTRLLKATCGECGYTVRVTKKWVDDVGPPHCPLHGAMAVEGWEPPEPEEDPEEERGDGPEDEDEERQDEREAEELEQYYQGR